METDTHDISCSTLPPHHINGAGLLDDADFNRFFLNLKRNSPVAAYENVRRMGIIHALFGKTPRDLAKMSAKQATNFVLDAVTELEKRGFSGNYVDTLIKPLKAWLNANQIQLIQKVKIRRSGDSIRFGNEITLTPRELHDILEHADLREKAAISLMAFTGIRPRNAHRREGEDRPVRDL